MKKSWMVKILSKRGLYFKIIIIDTKTVGSKFCIKNTMFMMGYSPQEYMICPNLSYGYVSTITVKTTNKGYKLIII